MVESFTWYTCAGGGTLYMVHLVPEQVLGVEPFTWYTCAGDGALYMVHLSRF